MTQATNRGHWAPTSCVAVSTSGDAYASGSYDQSILIWDAESGSAMQRLTGHTGLINGVDWSPDGSQLASASSDRTARIFDVKSGRELTRLCGHGDDVNAVRFSPSGYLLATASFDGTVRVWTLRGECVLVAGHHGSDVNSVRWLPNGRQLAAASDDGSVSVFDLDGGRVRRHLAGHPDWVDDVAVHPNGAHLATACLDGSVSIFDVACGQRLAKIDEASCVVKAVAYSPDGAELASAAYDGCVRIYETTTYRRVRTLRHEGLWNRTLSWSPRGWVTGSFSGGPVVLAPGGNLELGTSPTHGLNGFALAGDGSAIVCSDDGRAYAVDLGARRVVGEVARHRAAVLCAAVSPDGRTVATGSWDRSVVLWDRGSAKPVLEWPGSGEPINALAFHPSGRKLFAGTFNGEIVEWDLDSSRVRSLGRHRGSVKALAVTEAGAVVSVGRDGVVHQLGDDAATSFRAGTTILNDVCARDRRVATASRRDGVQLFRGTGELIAQFDSHPCSAKSVSFMEDGRIAAGYYDGHLGVWDPATGATRVAQVSEDSLSKVASHDEELIVSSWDACGSLLFVDPASFEVERVSVTG